MNIFEDVDLRYKFCDGDKIVIGCSAGPDSMALVDIMNKLKSKYNLSLIIVHINHNVREESIVEENYVKSYCEVNNLMYESMTIEEYGDDNFENEARNIRYNYFNEVVKKYDADYLMTAHHSDDLIETILMRLVRGSSLSGYAGFKDFIEMDNYVIVRPLFNYTKEEIINYNKENNIKYFIDKSNESTCYTRNRYRMSVLPFLKNEDINVHNKFIKFNKLLFSASSFIEKERDKIINDVVLKNKVDILKFRDIDSFLQREIFYYLLSEFYQDDLLLINDRHVDLLMNLIYSKRANVSINLPNDVVATKSYNYLELKRNTDVIVNYEVEIIKFVELPNNHFIEKVDTSSDYSNNSIRLSSDEILLPLIVRTRKIGDKIKIKGMNGSKKIKDVFIDSKVKLDDRDSWPVVVDSKGEVIWLPGLKKSKFDKKNTESYDIILKYS